MGKTAVKSENRRPYLKDIVRDENEDLVYTGDMYRISPGREISSHEGGSVSSAGTRTGAEAEIEDCPGRIYLQLIIRSLIPGVLSIASGCTGGAGSSHAFYVILPYIGEISALFAIYWSLVKLLAEKNRIRAYILERNLTRIRGASIILSLCALAGLAAAIFYLTQHGFSGSDMTGAGITAGIPAGITSDLAYPAFKALTSASSALFGIYFRSLKWNIVARSPKANS